MASARLRSLKLLVDFVVLSGGQLFSNVIGFLAFAFLARALGPKSYGTLEYVLGLTAVFLMVTDFGLGSIGVRDASQSPERLPSLAANIPFARLFIVAISVPLMLGVAVFAHHDALTTELTLLFAVGLVAAAWKGDWLFQARELMGRAAFAQNLRMIVFAGGVWLFVRSAADLLRVGWIDLAAGTVATAYYLLVQQLAVTPVRFDFSIAEVRDLLRQGLSVGGGQMVAALNMYAPVLLVGTLAGVEQAAWFGASHRIVISLSTFGLVYHFNLYPVLARRVAGARAELEALLSASFRVISWISVGGALALTLLGDELMKLAFGGRFVAAASAFKVLVWFLPVSVLSGHARWLLVATKRQEYVLYAQLWCAIATFGVSAALARPLGATGVAVAMVVAATVLWIASHIYARKWASDLPGAAPTVAPSLLAALVAFATHWFGASGWLGASLAACVYFAVGLLLDRRLVADVRSLARAKADFA